MVIRVVVGVAWSLVTGFAGGWLLISPWALGLQPNSGDWSDVTKAQFWTGTGLVALAVASLLLVAAQIARAVPGVMGSRGGEMRSRAVSSSTAGSAEVDGALAALANALAADLNRQAVAGSTPPPAAAEQVRTR